MCYGFNKGRTPAIDSVIIPIILFGVLLLTNSCEKQRANDSGVFDIMANTTIISNMPFVYHDSLPVLLDLYLPVAGLGEPPWHHMPDEPKPTLLYFHGGGWSQGDRISRSLLVLPYLQRGWSVVLADYKFAGINGVEDCMNDCKLALEWIYENAATYRFDTTKLVLSGESAGGHLALLTGMRERDQRKENIKAIVNWFGVTDFPDIIPVWNDTTLIKTVFGKMNRDSVITAWSPVYQLSASTPPIISLHGSVDVGVPISQSETLHKKLDALKVRNYLFPIANKKHGNFSPTEYQEAFDKIFQFLDSK